MFLKKKLSKEPAIILQILSLLSFIVSILTVACDKLLNIKQKQQLINQTINLEK